MSHESAGNKPSKNIKIIFALGRLFAVSSNTLNKYHVNLFCKLLLQTTFWKFVYSTISFANCRYESLFLQIVIVNHFSKFCKLSSKTPFLQTLQIVFPNQLFINFTNCVSGGPGPSGGRVVMVVKMVRVARVVQVGR